jgi:hypothetical protein
LAEDQVLTDNFFYVPQVNCTRLGCCDHIAYTVVDDDTSERLYGFLTELVELPAQDGTLAMVKVTVSGSGLLSKRIGFRLDNNGAMVDVPE